jgi:7,8-dihydropterin-6-yl-methyl-4-(beta-D-ribofuranosyl)aminobenzene 5'-phosphate synthase
VTGASASGGPATRIRRPRVTVLLDNESVGHGLRTEHGLSLWVEAGERHLLIDAGETPAFAGNAAQLGVDLSAADAIALSHGHYDHAGGLPAALEAAPRATVFVHPAALLPRFSRERRKRPEPIGMPAASREALMKAAGRIVWTDAPAELIPGVWSTGTVPRDEAREPGDPGFFFDASCTMPDPVPDDQSFWIDTPDGLWVILGCAHSGVLATLEHIDRLTGSRPLAKLVGGTHLMYADAARVTLVADELVRRAPLTLAPCHCTGRAAAASLGRALPDAIMPVGAGAVIE